MRIMMITSIMKRSIPRAARTYAAEFGTFLNILILGAFFASAIPALAGDSGNLGNPGDLYVGAATADITPDRPVLLQGQFNTRIARSAATPITANVIALEARDGQRPLDRVILVSIDVCTIRPNLRDAISGELAKIFPQFDAAKDLIIAATHTHTSVATSNDYTLPAGVDRSEILMEDDAARFLGEKIAPAIVRAWEGRVRAQFSYGLGNAVVAFNRRSVYADGSAVMYGPTNRSDFRKVEGMEDHDVGCCFFWDTEGKLLAMIVNPSCPSQEVEGLSVINADYWHPVREALHEKYGADVVIAGFCGAAGDLSPHVRYRNKAIDRMTRLRGEDNLHEIARKIVAAVDEVYPVVEPEKSGAVSFERGYFVADLPQQRVPAELCEKFRQEAAELKTKLDADANNGADNLYVNYYWTKGVVDRYEAQQGVENPTFPVGVHVLRLNDLAICTNPFELYTDFGVQIKARSKATQTIIIQLASQVAEGGEGYVPSQYATQGGGYGAIPQSNLIGAEGGQLYTEKTIEAINALFAE